MSNLVPPVDGEIVTATKTTCMAYGQNALQYIQATKSYDGFLGLREEVLAFAAACNAQSPVLDLGSGGGRDSRLLAEYDKRVISGDMCYDVLAEVQRVTPLRTGIASACLDACCIPFRDDSFGGVWACGCLLHIPAVYQSTALTEVFRVLQPGGIATINMQSGSSQGWRDGGTLPGRRWFTLVQPEEFSSLMEKCGFTNLSHHPVGRVGWFSISGFKPMSPADSYRSSIGQDPS